MDTLTRYLKKETILFKLLVMSIVFPYRPINRKISCQPFWGAFLGLPGVRSVPGAVDGSRLLIKFRVQPYVVL